MRGSGICRARLLVVSLVWCLTVGCGGGDGGGQNLQNQNNSQQLCGNGVLEMGEVCDDGPENSDNLPDACRSDCRQAYCGDGVVDTGEDCDEGAAMSDLVPGACRRNCQLPGCGDGVVDPAESCDDGNTTSGDGCAADCQVEDLFGCVGSPSVCTCLPYRAGTQCRRCVVYVDGALADQGGDGQSWTTALGTIQPGLDTAYQAGPGCEVWVTAGTYPVYEDSVMNALRPRDGVALYGGFVGTETDREQRDWENQQTVLSGRNADQSHRVLHVVSAIDIQDATMDGVTVAYGDAQGLLDEDQIGAGLYIAGSRLTLANCTIRDNYAHDHGGGLFAYGSSVELHGCRVEHNDAIDGGGGVALFLSDASLFDSTFDDNAALGSGTPDSHGGALYAHSSQLKVDRCTFVDNYVGVSGGALYLWFTDSVLVNTVLTDNQADQGGALYNLFSDVHLLHATVVWNDATQGSALYRGSGSTTTFTSSIIWYNYGSTFWYSGDSSATYTTSDVTIAGEGNLTLEPAFVSNFDYHLQANSPCVDSAFGPGAPTTDLEGTLRYDVTTVNDVFNCDGQPDCISYADMGAYEHHP